MSSTFARVLASLGFVSFGLLGCGGSDGDACQVGGDCSSGLVCCKSSPSAPLTERGVCQATCTFVAVDAAVADAAPVDSATSVDGGDAEASQPDASDVDAAAAD